jgi:hypothetical protein
MNPENWMKLTACKKTVKLMLKYYIHIELTADVTCQQRMLTPLIHPFPCTSGPNVIIFLSILKKILNSNI